MAQTHTFAECYRLLDVDPKTFGRWLEKAGIDPKQQVSKVDNRIRFLTQEQIDKLAADHGRTLSPLKEQASTESTTPGAHKLLIERVDSLENTLKETQASNRSEVSNLEAQLHDALDLLGKALERLTTLEDQFTEAQETIATLQVSKRTTRAKSEPASTDTLPEGLTPWRPFANTHHAPQTTVYRYIGNGLIHVVKGKWKVGNGYVQELLDDKGRHDFWVQLHTNESFIPCDDCPHDIEAGTR